MFFKRLTAILLTGSLLITSSNLASARPHPASVSLIQPQSALFTRIALSDPAISSGVIPRTLSSDGRDRQSLGRWLGLPTGQRPWSILGQRIAQSILSARVALLGIAILVIPQLVYAQDDDHQKPRESAGLLIPAIITVGAFYVVLALLKWGFGINIESSDDEEADEETSDDEIDYVSQIPQLNLPVKRVKPSYSAEPGDTIEAPKDEKFTDDIAPASDVFLLDPAVLALDKEWDLRKDNRNGLLVDGIQIKITKPESDEADEEEDKEDIRVRIGKAASGENTIYFLVALVRIPGNDMARFDAEAYSKEELLQKSKWLLEKILPSLEEFGEDSSTEYSVTVEDGVKPLTNLSDGLGDSLWDIALPDYQNTFFDLIKNLGLLSHADKIIVEENGETVEDLSDEMSDDKPITLRLRQTTQPEEPQVPVSAPVQSVVAPPVRAVSVPAAPPAHAVEEADSKWSEPGLRTVEFNFNGQSHLHNVSQFTFYWTPVMTGQDLVNSFRRQFAAEVGHLDLVVRTQLKGDSLDFYLKRRLPPASRYYLCDEPIGVRDYEPADISIPEAGSPRELMVVPLETDWVTATDPTLTSRSLVLNSAVDDFVRIYEGPANYTVGRIDSYPDDLVRVNAAVERAFQSMGGRGAFFRAIESNWHINQIEFKFSSHLYISGQVRPHSNGWVGATVDLNPSLLAPGNEGALMEAVRKGLTILTNEPPDAQKKELKTTPLNLRNWDLAKRTLVIDSTEGEFVRTYQGNGNTINDSWEFPKDLGKLSAIVNKALVVFGGREAFFKLIKSNYHLQQIEFKFDSELNAPEKTRPSETGWFVAYIHLNPKLLAPGNEEALLGAVIKGLVNVTTKVQKGENKEVKTIPIHLSHWVAVAGVEGVFKAFDTLGSGAQYLRMALHLILRLAHVNAETLSDSRLTSATMRAFLSVPENLEMVELYLYGMLGKIAIDHPGFLFIDGLESKGPRDQMAVPMGQQAIHAAA
jgi:hypothetical protein